MFVLRGYWLQSGGGWKNAGICAAASRLCGVTCARLAEGCRGRKSCLEICSVLGRDFQFSFLSSHHLPRCEL